jgi:hypothetical protein
MDEIISYKKCAMQNCGITLTETKIMFPLSFLCVKTLWNRNNYYIIVTCKKFFQDVQ